MFYSHEVLTSRKYGVATVWLVATLGSKSTLKKVNRKAILDVNVPKACETIIAPEAPMALRLQSNLLYGVSRVYAQQCGYVLIDAQNAQNNIRALFKIVRTSELDPDAGKVRPDQLILQDDPAFLPDLPNLDFDLSALDLSTDGSSRRSSNFSSLTGQSSRSSDNGGDGSLLGLVIPTSDSGGAADIGGFALVDDRRGSVRPPGQPGFLLEEEEGGFFPDNGLGFDDDGNLVEARIVTPVERQEAVPTHAARLGSGSAASGRVRREHEEGLQAGQQELGGGMDLDIENPIYMDESNIPFPEAEPFLPLAIREEADSGFLKSSSAVPEKEESSESADAPQRRKPKKPKVLAMDLFREVRNADLAQWNNEYMGNMAEAAQAKMLLKTKTQARKNATFWIFGSGVGGVGSGIGSTNYRSPLDMFAGEQLLEALTGITTPPSGKKRRRSEEDSEGSESEERRIRRRDGRGAEVGRGDGIALRDDGMMTVAEDRGEIGRDAQPLLDDFSSQMPWNITGSIHGSLQGSRQGSIVRAPGFASSLGGFPTSTVGPPSSLPSQIPGGAPVGSIGRRASRRITSASPLLGEQHLEEGFDLPTMHDDEDDLLGNRMVSDDTAFDEFQLYGPAAAVNTQTAAQSQWMKATLDQESANFLEFVKAEIANRTPAPVPNEDEGEVARGESEAEGRGVLFEELLSPTVHSKVVAAQAFHHVLALATKNLISVKQAAGYGPIRLEVAVDA